MTHAKRFLPLIVGLALFLTINCAVTEGSTFTAGKTGAALKEWTLKVHLQYKVTEVTAECNVDFSGETEALESSSLVLVPSYKTCLQFGSNSTTINTEGCIYKLTATTNEAGLATMHLEKCSSGGILITMHYFGTCHIFVKNQEIKGVRYENLEGALIVSFEASAIHAEVTKVASVCPLSAGTHTNMSYVGQSKIEAEGTTLQWDK